MISPNETDAVDNSPINRLLGLDHTSPAWIAWEKHYQNILKGITDKSAQTDFEAFEEACRSELGEALPLEETKRLYSLFDKEINTETEASATDLVTLVLLNVQTAMYPEDFEE